MPVINPSHVEQVLEMLQDSAFTTLDYVNRFMMIHPDDWRLLVARYGGGGAGGGSRYSANSYLALRLNDRRNQGTLNLLGYEDAPAGWGHERIARWQM